MKVIVCAALLLAAPALRAEEKFQERVEDVMKTDWRKEVLESLARERAARPDLAPPVLSTAPADEGRILLRFSFEEKGKGWRDDVSMSMTLKTFERYRRIERDYEDAVAVFGRDKVDPSRYFSFSGRDAAAIGDVLFTSLEKSPFVQSHPWLDGPVSWIAEGMRQFDRFDRGSAWDVLGFEVDDWVTDRFGLGGPSRFGRREEVSLGLYGPVQGSPDGDFHGKLRFGIRGLERAATRFDADPIRFKVKYEIRCPSAFVLDKIEVGGEVRPFCRGEEGKDFRLYIGGGKSF